MHAAHILGLYAAIAVLAKMNAVRQYLGNLGNAIYHHLVHCHPARVDASACDPCNGTQGCPSMRDGPAGRPSDASLLMTDQPQAHHNEVQLYTGAELPLNPLARLAGAFSFFF